MATNRSKKNKSVIIIAVLSALVIAGFLLLFTNPSFWFRKSIHEDAKKYSTKHCLVFYPDGNYGKEYAKYITKQSKDDRIYDYSLVPYGDYYFVSYGNNLGYFVDHDYNTLEITDISDDGKKIVADYLRYTIKKEQPDKYYNAEFLASTVFEKLDFSNIKYSIDGEYLKCNMPDYDVDIMVPLKYVQKELNMNFGYKDELYVKPVYIDRNPEHPVICLTFDDGPQFWYEPDESSSVKIVDTLYKYDANATFYVVGYCLDERDSWTDFQAYNFFKKSIANGNEYGSHTENHDNLVDFSTAEGVKNSINYPGEFLNDLVGYNMLTYRPPGGVFDDGVLKAQPYPAILWNVDSEDWISRDPDTIYQHVLDSKLVEGDIILFHDIYDETAEAVEKLVPELINEGFQIVTVKDMLAHENIDVGSLSYYYNLNPWPYYE